MTILDAYGEDGDFVRSAATIVNTSGYFRAGYARCALYCGVSTASAYRLWPCGALASGWVTFRLYFTGSGGSGHANAFGLCDVNGITRLQFTAVNNNSPTNNWNIYKVSSTGSTTLLGTTSGGFTQNGSPPDKLDINWSYGSSGTLKIYINKNLVFNYSGDLTTSGTITGYAGTSHGEIADNGYVAYSEFCVANSDTRDLDIITQYATGSGSEDDWTGTYTNVSGYAVNDANFDTTATSGNIQLYAQSSAGTSSSLVVGVVTNVRATAGGGSLGNIELVQQIGGTLYSSSEIALPSSFSQVQFIQQTSPASGVAFTQSELNTSYQLGVKALT
jgi:hypothetical protein